MRMNRRLIVSMNLYFANGIFRLSRLFYLWSHFACFVVTIIYI